MTTNYWVLIRDFNGNTIIKADTTFIADAVDVAKACGVWADVVDARTGELLITYHDNEIDYTIF